MKRFEDLQIKSHNNKFKNICVFDTETCNTLEEPYIYDIAYTIVNNTSSSRNPLLQRQLLILDVLNTGTVRENEFADKQWHFYEKMLNDKNHLRQVVTLKQAVMIIKADFDKYNVDSISAYNLKFDLNALKTTFKTFIPKWYEQGVMDKLFNNKHQIDLWLNTTKYITNSLEFINYSVATSRLSLKGKIISNAENVYRFLSKDYWHTEEHTALKDVMLEADILKYLLDNDFPLVTGINSKLGFQFTLEKVFWGETNKHNVNRLNNYTGIRPRAEINSNYPIVYHSDFKRDKVMPISDYVVVVDYLNTTRDKREVIDMTGLQTKNRQYLEHIITKGNVQEVTFLLNFLKLNQQYCIVQGDYQKTLEKIILCEEVRETFYNSGILKENLFKYE